MTSALIFFQKEAGAAGYRSPYLSHAKRALYHLSYSPMPFSLLKCLFSLCSHIHKDDLFNAWSSHTAATFHQRNVAALVLCFSHGDIFLFFSWTFYNSKCWGGCRFYGVMVSTLDSESNNPSSRLGRTWHIFELFMNLSYFKSLNATFVCFLTLYCLN